VTGGGVERVPSPGGACWICGLTAVCGEKLPGKRHKVRALCQSHADAVFGMQDPPWRQLDEKTQREIVDEWLRSITILAYGGHRPAGELLAEIAAVNDTGIETIRLMSPLMPGEARDLQETQRAVNRLRSRETMVHAAVTQVLLDWHATATGQSRGEVVQKLALKLSAVFGESGPPDTSGAPLPARSRSGSPRETRFPAATPPG
jgi:hypothetical protein